MKRTELNPVSTKRTTENRERRTALETAFGPRDAWACFASVHRYDVMGPCFGPINGHEIVKRSQGGSITDPENVILLCDRHNEWVENFPLDAHRLGLMKHSWEES